MKIIRNLVIGGKEPTDVNVGWLKPTEDNSFRLLVFNGDGWYPVAIDVTIESVGKLMF